MERNTLYTDFWNLLQTSEDYLKFGMKSGVSAPDFTAPHGEEPSAELPTEGQNPIPRPNPENCSPCSMAKSGRRPVAPLGRPEAPLWVITDAPSLEAERLNVPLGEDEMEYFRKWMTAIELKVPDDLYLQNLTHCRTPGSRPPFPEELKRCASEIAASVRQYKPKLIFSMGPYCSAWLTGQGGMKISAIRDVLYHWEGVPLVVSYSPDQVLSYGELKRPVWEDLKRLRKLL